MTVDAGTQQHLESACKRVLMDAGGAVEPVVDVDVKPGTGKESDGRITELSRDIFLLGKRDSGMNPANDLPGIDSRGKIRFGECLRGDFGKLLLAVVLRSPT